MSGDEILPNVGDHIIKHDIRIAVEQPGFNGKKTNMEPKNDGF